MYKILLCYSEFNGNLFSLSKYKCKNKIVGYVADVWKVLLCFQDFYISQEHKRLEKAIWNLKLRPNVFVKSKLLYTYTVYFFS